MSNAKRPSTARTRTPKDEQAREAALNDSMTIEVDGTRYTMVPADVTGLIEMRVRKETGMSVVEIMQKLETAPGMDLIGCFMYACEVASGRDADLEDILGSVSLGSDFEVVDGNGEPVPVPQL